MLEKENSREIVGIVSAGGKIHQASFCRAYLEKCTYVIACDGGLNILHKLNILPDIWVGDGDSVSQRAWSWIKKYKICIQKYPVKKDATDTKLAIDIAINKHPKLIYILNGTGNRLDHTLGNLHLLEYAHSMGYSARIISYTHSVSLITPHNKVIIHGKAQDTISILPVSQTISGLTMSGVYWPLRHATIHRGTTLTISNEILNKVVIASLKRGIAYIIHTWQEIC